MMRLIWTKGTRASSEGQCTRAREGNTYSRPRGNESSVVITEGMVSYWRLLSNREVGHLDDVPGKEHTIGTRSTCRESSSYGALTVSW